MKISVNNLGAIKEATIELGGLTVFVGPNGTGKSYLAKVLYGLQGHETLAASYFSNKDRFHQILLGEKFKISSHQDAVSYLQKLTPTALQKAIPALVNLHAELLKNRLPDYFNDDSNLFDDTTVTVSEIDTLPDSQVQNIINYTLDQFQNIINYPLDHFLDKPDEQKIPVDYVFWVLYWNLFWGMGGGFADYFPAARSNFMLTYKALYRARADEHVGLESISDKLLLASKGNQTRKTGALLRFDRPTEDFISHLYDLDSSNESSLANISTKLEHLLYGNDHLVIEQPEGALPDFRYQIKNSESKIRLHLTSSMVTETSPLLIGFKYWVQSNSLVIIDEPESHLHPEAQRALVNGLVEAVNQGLELIIITHSPYILLCVNNLIKFGSLIKKFSDNEDVQKLKDENPEMVALEKKVHAYHFGTDGIVKSIVRESGLIDESEFTEPFDRINELYEEMRDIEWEHR